MTAGGTTPPIEPPVTPPTVSGTYTINGTVILTPVPAK